MSASACACVCVYMCTEWMEIIFWGCMIEPPRHSHPNTDASHTEVMKLKTSSGLSEHFSHWESAWPYIRPAWSFVIINHKIYGWKYVIRRRVLSSSLWLGGALWHIDQVNWGTRPKWPRPWIWTSTKAWPWNVRLILRIHGNFPLCVREGESRAHYTSGLGE